MVSGSMSKASVTTSSPNPADRRIALCLGPHRSGTSLIAAAIRAVGADLALSTHEASEENARGFFEHPEVVALDDDLLRAAGSAWDDVTFDSGDLARIPADTETQLSDAAARIVTGQFRPAPLAAVKDPRMCRLLPFWFPVLAAAGYDDSAVRCIIVTRDPVEAAISQRTRAARNGDFYDFGRDLIEGALLWSSHMRQALRDCGPRDMLVVAYRDFLDRPAELMGRIAAYLGVVPDDAAIADFVAGFVSKALWRSHPDAREVADIEARLPGLIAAEARLAALSGQVVPAATLAPIRAALDDIADDVQTRGVVSRAYGRLSDRRRTERAAALRDRHALDVAIAARDAFARERDELAKVSGQQVEALRDRVTALDAAVADREREIARLRDEQATAIRQIGEGIRSLDHQLAELRDERKALGQELRSAQDERDALGRQIDDLSAELADSRAELARQDDARAALLQDLRGARDERDALGRQLAEANEIASYLGTLSNAMQASHSWRITAPLRAAGTMLRSTTQLPRTGLRGLNRTSQVVHQRLKRSHPKTAELLRRGLQPLMTRANMRVLGQATVPAPPAPSTGDPASVYQRPADQAPYRPLVTVIVPNYNHAPYLAQRLESIFAQTYDHFEVLLLDDCSTDESRAILTDFAARHPDKARTVFNETNSGGVFRQWERGLAEARGDLVWIAESDDWASPNFLETLVPFFRNEAIQLAYARTIFMDATGEKQIWSMEEYLNDHGPERWGRPWVETAPNIVRDVFSMVNIVPNVSSAMFRRFDRMDVLEIDAWRTMRTCGDWMFYLNAIRGGLMAYSPDAQNYYRIHDKNTSVTSHKADQFYREHEEVAKCARRHYSVPTDNLLRMDANLRHHWKLTRGDYSDAAFAACFDLGRIKAAPVRAPNLLMVSYAFCSGGGEAFPIQLANEMKSVGYQVTFLDCAQEERVEGVRARLANDIPVVSNLPDLRRITADFDIDVIHTHHGWADNTVLDLMPEGEGASTVITLHGFYETMPDDQLGVLLPRLMRRTAAMVYIADKNLVPMQRDGALPDGMFHRIDNAVSPNLSAPVDRAALGIAADAFVMVVVSRALPEKGWAEAIESTIRAREISGRDIHLIPVGDGGGEAEAEAAGVPGFIHLEGFRPNTQDYFAAADLGVLPSRFKGESFPLVVIESLIAGTPVLASNVGEIASMLATEEGPAGVLFDLNEDWSIDTEALARIIARLATDPAEVSALRDRVPLAARRFDPRLMAGKYDAVYRQAAGLPAPLAPLAPPAQDHRPPSARPPGADH